MKYDGYIENERIWSTTSCGPQAKCYTLELYILAKNIMDMNPPHKG